MRAAHARDMSNNQPVKPASIVFVPLPLILVLHQLLGSGDNGVERY
jgi:hypothetical protein